MGIKEKSENFNSLRPILVEFCNKTTPSRNGVKSLVKIKIQTESFLHCIDKYADDCTDLNLGNSACELFEINIAEPTQHLEPEIR